MAYFDNFPIGVYSNTQCVDLTRRVALRKSLVADSRTYLPYELRSGERADQVAQHYYSDTDNTWMVYMSAGTVDPYHEWYLDQNSFDEHIRVKYGSQEKAIEATAHWQLEWSTDETELSVSGYEALDPQLKKYWEAVYGNQGSRVLSYARRQEDWTVATNMVVRLEIEPQNDVAIAAGEQLLVYDGPTYTGVAEVAWANSSVVKVIHVQSGLVAGYGLGTDAGANATITDVRYVSNTIPVDERPYWSRVSAYDHEYGRNEGRKHVRLVDKKYANELKNQLRRVLKED